MRQLYLLFFWTVLGSLPATVYATHIVGGEITYRCLGGQTYQVILTVYRDCYNGRPAFDDPAIVGVYSNGTNFLFRKLELAYDKLTNDTLPIVLNNPCLVGPPDVCVHKATYTGTVTLPYRPDGYTLIYQRCCRNQLIRNIPAPLNTGISFTANISGESLQNCNTSASFVNWPPVAICVHQPVDFDHSATDQDGDSLVYRLCTPLNGPDSLNAIPDPPSPPPYPELEWIDPPYSLANILGGQPLSIDSSTGFMTGVPNTVGNFVVGVCVDEYRGGIYLSTTRRDFQYNVADCGQPAASFFVPQTVCDTLTVRFANESRFSTFFRWYFDWPQQLSQTSVAFSPVHTYPDTGTYRIALVAEPNTPCADTFIYTLNLTLTEGGLAVSADPEEITRGESSQLTAYWGNAVSYTWDPPSHLDITSGQTPVASPPETTTYTVTATLDNGCSRQASVEVRVLPPPCGPPFVFLPAAFSPNGDGENEVLKLESNITVEVYWAIYNRWGEKVFEADSLDDYWDGFYKGAEQPAETYGYYLRARCADGQEMFRKGNITLLR